MSDLTEHFRQHPQRSSSPRTAPATRAIAASRELIRHCSEAIRAIHRREWDNAEAKLATAQQAADDLRAVVARLSRPGCTAATPATRSRKWSKPSPPTRLSATSRCRRRSRCTSRATSTSMGWRKRRPNCAASSSTFCGARMAISQRRSRAPARLDGRDLRRTGDVRLPRRDHGRSAAPHRRGARRARTHARRPDDDASAAALAGGAQAV